MAQMKRVTLKDIAARTGYTVNTVSRALKDKSDISEDTRRFIQKTAKEMGYVQNFAASSLRSGESKTLAVIVSDIANPLFGAMVRDIERAAQPHGYSIIIFNTGEDFDWERAAILNAYSKQVDGILICPVQKSTENIALLQTLGVPFILVGRYFRDMAVDAVYWNDTKAGELATEYFLRQGHVNILFIGGPLYVSSGADRLEGYRIAHRNAGVPVKEALIRITSITADASRQTIRQVLSEAVPFTAMVVFSDIMAYEVLSELQGHAQRQIAQIPISSFDNIREKLMLPFCFPSVGSREDIASICVGRLLDKLQKSAAQEASVTVLDVELMNAFS